MVFNKYRNMSSTDQSNTPTAESYQQEDQDVEAYGAAGASTGGVRGAHNSRYQQASTATVFLGAATGTATSVFAKTFITSLQKQHLIYGGTCTSGEQPTLNAATTLVLPRRVVVWGEPGQVVTVKFFEHNAFQDVNAPPIAVRQSKQFYSIGLEGAQRPEISWKWNAGMVGNRPWQATDAQNPLFQVAGTTAAGAVGGPWFCQLTCTFYNTDFISPIPAIFMIDTDTVDYAKRKREEEKAREVKRIKDLTLPATME